MPFIDFQNIEMIVFGNFAQFYHWFLEKEYCGLLILSFRTPIAFPLF